MTNLIEKTSVEIESSSLLPESFYTRSDVVEVARDLLGKCLFTQIENDPITGGIIVETEAYKGPEDKASHAYGNRRTERTEVLFKKGGSAYVYLCYGIHYLLNVVTNIEGIPHGVLVRGISPTQGISTMLKRRKKEKLDATLTKGPGAVAQALGVNLQHKGLRFFSSPLWIEDRELKIKHEDVFCGRRIGVDYAKEHALLPWRFWIDPRSMNL